MKVESESPANMGRLGQEQQRQRDPEMHQARKGKPWHFA